MISQSTKFTKKLLVFYFSSTTVLIPILLSEWGRKGKSFQQSGKKWDKVV
jgi:hypothetical protein